MDPALTHIAYHVRDVAACTAFYREYCGLDVVHERGDAQSGQVVWLAEPGKERDFIIVLISGGPGREQADNDYGHIGFAVEDRAAVDDIAERADAAGCLVWAPRAEPYPVGYYCGLRDPDGNFVEFSYGQPLGPGAPPEDGQ